MVYIRLVKRSPTKKWKFSSVAGRFFLFESNVELVETTKICALTTGRQIGIYYFIVKQINEVAPYSASRFSDSSRFPNGWISFWENVPLLFSFIYFFFFFCSSTCYFEVDPRNRKKYLYLFCTYLLWTNTDIKSESIIQNGFIRDAVRFKMGIFLPDKIDIACIQATR